MYISVTMEYIVLNISWWKWVLVVRFMAQSCIRGGTGVFCPPPLPLWNLGPNSKFTPTTCVCLIQRQRRTFKLTMASISESRCYWHSATPLKLKYCVFQWTIFAIEPKWYIVLFNNLPYNIFGVWLKILAGRLAPIICNETMKLTYLTKHGMNGRHRKRQKELPIWKTPIQKPRWRF